MSLVTTIGFIITLTSGKLTFVDVIIYLESKVILHVLLLTYFKDYIPIELTTPNKNSIDLGHSSIYVQFYPISNIIIYLMENIFEKDMARNDLFDQFLLFESGSILVILTAVVFIIIFMLFDWIENNHIRRWKPVFKFLYIMIIWFILTSFLTLYGGFNNFLWKTIFDEELVPGTIILYSSSLWLLLLIFLFLRSVIDIKDQIVFGST